MILVLACILAFFVCLYFVKKNHKNKQRNPFIYGLYVVYPATIFPYALFLWGIVPLEKFLLVDLPILYVTFMVVYLLFPGAFSEQKKDGVIVIFLVASYLLFEEIFNRFI